MFPSPMFPKRCYQTNIAALTYSYYDDAGAYGANHGRLLQINRKSKYHGTDTWQAYYFLYDTWGQTTAIRVRKPNGDFDVNTSSDYLTLASYEYDADSRLVKTKYPNNDYVTYDYDILDRLTHEVYHSGSNSIQSDNYYIYNSNGQLARQYVKDGNSGIPKEDYSFAAQGTQHRGRSTGDGSMCSRSTGDGSMCSREKF